MLTSVSLIKRVFLTKQDRVTIEPDGSIRTGSYAKEWVLEADRVNLKTVICVDGVLHTGWIRHPAVARFECT